MSDQPPFEVTIQEQSPFVVELAAQQGPPGAPGASGASTFGEITGELRDNANASLELTAIDDAIDILSGQVEETQLALDDKVDTGLFNESLATKADFIRLTSNPRNTIGASSYELTGTLTSDGSTSISVPITLTEASENNWQDGARSLLIESDYWWLQVDDAWWVSNETSGTAPQECTWSPQGATTGTPVLTFTAGASPTTGQFALVDDGVSLPTAWQNLGTDVDPNWKQMPLGDYVNQLAAALSAHINTTGNAHNLSAAQVRSILGVSTLSGSNTGDQDLSGLATTSAVAAGYVALTGNQTVAGVKTFSSPILTPNGTAANPSHSFSGYTGAGMSTNGSALILSWAGGLVQVVDSTATQFVGNARPYYDDAYRLGASTQRWKQIFLNQTGIKIGDGTNGPTITASGTSPNESLVLTPAGTGVVSIPGNLTASGNAVVGGVVHIGNNIELGSDSTSLTVLSIGGGGWKKIKAGHIECYDPTLSIFTGPISCSNLTVSGTVSVGQSAQFTGATYTPSGTTQTIDLNASSMNLLSLGSTTGDLTLTITPLTNWGQSTIRIVQHATTPRNITIVFSSGTSKWYSAIPAWSGQTVGKHTTLIVSKIGTVNGLSAVEEV